MGFSRKDFSQNSLKKRSRKHPVQKSDSRMQTHEQRTALEHRSSLPADPIFDLFLAQQKQTHKQILAKIHPESLEAAIARGISLIHRTAWRSCERIFLSPGVVAMLDEIFHDPEPYGLTERLSYHLPSPTWITIEEVNFTPFYELLDFKVRGIFILKVFTPENLALLKKQPFARPLLRTLDLSFANLRDFVTVQFIGARGECLFKLEWQQSAQIWRIAGEHRCPYHACVAVAGRFQQPCECCEMALDLFSRWLPICILALQGRFRQIEQEGTPELATKRGNGPGKTPSPPVRIVRTIDLSVKPARSIDEEEAEALAGTARGSWVEKAKAVDPNLVKKEEREVPERTRTLKHPRYRHYIEQHGTDKVKVRAHTRSVPLLAVPRATRARAQRYDKQEEQ